MAPWVTALIGPIAKLLEKVIPDKDLREKLAYDIATQAATQAHEISQAQIELNRQEAAHSSLFVAGWRPFAGWVCVSAMAFNFIGAPLINWGTQLSGSDVVLPILDLTIMMPVLLGMLGMGGLRTVDKFNRVEQKGRFFGEDRPLPPVVNQYDD
jgi:hypothetical protein